MKQLIENSKLKIVSLLRKSERFTKTDMVYLASGGFWVFAGQTISSLSVFVVAVAFANLLPQETYGAYKYILSLAAMFAVFTLPGMTHAVARAVARGNTSIAKRALKWRIRWSLVGSAAALFGGFYYFLNGNAQLGSALFLIAVMLPFYDTYTLYNAYLTGTRDFKKQTLYHLVTQSLSAVALVITLFLTDNLLLILLAYFLPVALARIVIFKKTVPETETGAQEDKDDITYGKHLSAINLLGVVAGNVDKILLWKFLGPAQLAIYAFAIAIPEQVRGPLKGMSNIMLPKFAIQPPDNNGRYSTPHGFWYKFLLYTIFLGLASLAYIAIAPLLFTVFFPAYTSSVLFSQVLALALVTGAQTMPATLLTAHGRAKTQYVLSIIRSVTQIILFIVLIPMFGIMGAVIATIIANVVNLIGTVIAVVIK